MNSNEANKAFDAWWVEQPHDLNQAFTPSQVATVQSWCRWAFNSGIIAELEHALKAFKAEKVKA